MTLNEALEKIERLELALSVKQGTIKILSDTCDRYHDAARNAKKRML